MLVATQFGITRKGLKRLPAWLSEGANMPRAVELLCDDGMNPFSRVWRELRAFRKGHKKRSEIRQLLQDSPFFPNDWVEEILQYAKSEKKSATREVDDAADLLDDTTSFVTGPFLSWPPGGEPSLLYRVHPENGTLNDYGYDILVNETVVGRLTKQPDGSFQAEPDQLSVNLDSEFATIACVGDDTDEEIRTTLPTLSREDDWEFFDGESGVRKALDALATANSVVVCLPEDEDTQGAIEEFVLADPGRKLARYSSYAAVAQMAGQEADEEWDYTYETDEELDISSIRAEHHASATTRVRIGEPFEVFVTGVPRGASVNWARIEGRSVDCVPQNTGHTLITDLDASFAKTSVRIELSIRFAGRSHRVERRVALDFLGATMLEAGSWTACHNLVELRAKEAAERAFRFCVPRDGHSDWGLVEGEVFTERPVKGITSVKNLSGYGAPLWLRKGPYNSKGAGLCLAESVVDRGWLRGFGIYGDVFTFWLNRTIQPDPDYALHLWSPGEKLHTLGFDELQSPCLGQWKGLLPEGIDNSNYAFAMSFRGERLGGWWSKDFWIPEAVEAPTLTAQLIRWFHLPILSDSFLDEIKKFAHTYPEAALEAWLTLDEVGEFGLTQPSDDPQWLSAMRRIFLSAPSEVTNRAWRALISSRTTRAAFELILKVDPLLAVIMVLSSTTPLGHHLPSLILGSDILEGEREERARITELLRQAATETRSHPTFVQRTAEDIVSSLRRNEITALQRQNLSILCNRPAFRRYLAFIFYSDKRGT